MPRNLDSRIDEIIGEPGDWFVDLKPGWAFRDANGPNPQHCFGEDTKAAIRKSMKQVVACRCAECAAGIVEAG